MSIPDARGWPSPPRVERATRRVLAASSRAPATAACGGIVLGLAVSWLIAHLVGGAGMVAPHWFYLPVLYAAARFGCLGAGVSAVAAGLLAGPLTPSDIAAGIAQEPQDWIVRATFFVVIGQAMALVIGQSRSAMAAEAGVAVERARQEERLLSAETKYRSLVEHLPLATYIDGIDETSSNIYSSPQIEPLLGYSTEEWRTNPNLFPEILHPEDRERVLAEHARTHETGEPLRTEYRAIARDGRVVWIQDEAVIVKDERGEPLYLQGYRLDLTERKRLESDLLQAQKMDAVGQLAGGVAHDFNNMMSAVVGFSELVLARLDAAHPLRSHIEDIHRAGERASEMTHQLLAFSRKQMLQPRVLDVNGVVTETEKLLRRLIGENIDLVAVLDLELEPVEADRGQLEQVIMNLVVNARDAMPAGGKVTIETANVDLSDEYAASHVEVAPGRYVLLAVSDTGVGMDAETQARVFEPFFTTKEPGKGTGLGLATVFGIVKQSGGHVSVYSEPGRGTTFKVYLPRADEPSPSSHPAATQGQAPRGRETILLVEDEELVRNLEREALVGQGYTVLEAGSGSEALELAGNHDGPIHLLLTDVVMPELSGPELADRLTPLRPETKVLYASGYADEAIVRHGVLEPGIAFLPKPVTPSSLALKVREVLDEVPEPSGVRR